MTKRTLAHLLCNENSHYPPLCLLNLLKGIWAQSEPRRTPAPRPRAQPLHTSPAWLKRLAVWRTTTASVTCLTARLKGRLTRRSPGCHLRCVFKVRGCLRGFQLAVYPPPARWEACRSVASLAAKRDSSRVFLLKWKPESLTSSSTVGRSCRASEQRTKSDFILCVCVFHHDKTCTPEHGWFYHWVLLQPLKLSVCLFVDSTDCIFEFVQL